MALPASRTLLALLEVVRPALTAPSFANLRVLFSGWVQTAGTHAVTEALVATGVSAKRHHEAFHRFFSRGTWSPDAVAQRIVLRLLRSCGDGRVRIALDDTLAVRKGPHVFGLGCHLDPVRSTRRHKIFTLVTYGSCWQS